MTTYDEQTVRTGERDDLREVAWWLVVGAASGAIAGFAIGGIGGRLAMLLLRQTSPDLVIGMTSDDGFEIGVVTADTFQLILAMAMLGGINGVLYAALRGSIPRRLRLPLWTVFGAVAGGATVIHDNGVDFLVLEPVALAIVLFVALPGVASAAVVLLTERWVGREPFADRRLSIGLGVAALLGTFALVFAALAGLAALVVRKLGVAGAVGRIARVGVPVALVVATVALGAQLAETIGNLV